MNWTADDEFIGRIVIDRAGAFEYAILFQDQNDIQAEWVLDRSFAPLSSSSFMRNDGSCRPTHSTVALSESDGSSASIKFDGPLCTFTRHEVMASEHRVGNQMFYFLVDPALTLCSRPSRKDNVLEPPINQATSNVLQKYSINMNAINLLTVVPKWLVE
jgi:hypothetical protein